MIAVFGFPESCDDPLYFNGMRINLNNGIIPNNILPFNNGDHRITQVRDMRLLETIPSFRLD